MAATMMLAVGCTEAGEDGNASDVARVDATDASFEAGYDANLAAGLDAVSDAQPDASSTPDVRDAGTCTTRAPTDRALWVWQQSTVTHATERDAFVAVAASHHVRAIHLAAYDIVTDTPAALETFLRRAQANCIEVELLFGDSARVINHAPAIAIARRAVMFAATSNAPRVANCTRIESARAAGRCDVLV